MIIFHGLSSPRNHSFVVENAPFTLDDFKIFKMHSQCNFSKNVGGIKVVSVFVLALLSILFSVCWHTNSNQVQNAKKLGWAINYE